MKIISHAIRLIEPLRTAHRSMKFIQKFTSNTRIMFINVINIDIKSEIVIDLTKVDRTLLDFYSQRGMALNADGCLYTVLIQHLLNVNSKLFLIGLRDISHIDHRVVWFFIISYLIAD